MKKIRWFVMMTGAGVLISGLTGCATAPKAPKLTMQSIAFPSPMEVAAVPQLKDKNDPVAYVSYCLSLSECGRHGSAADFLMEAAEKFESTRNEFAISAYAAAASEYFDAGDMDKFLEALLKLRQTADRYQLASVGSELSAMLSLGDLVVGDTTPKEYTPYNLRALYRAAGK